MQEYLRAQLIELAGRPDATELAALIRDRKRLTGSTLAAGRILAHRHHDRR